MTAPVPHEPADTETPVWIRQPFTGPIRPPGPAGAAEPPGRRTAPDCCHGRDPHHEWNAAVRNETAMQQLDRNYAEILQEIRVAQTGVQLLLAFLLGLAFTPRFAMITEFEQGLYVATLVLGAASAALLMAPACYHRVVFRQRLKWHLVCAASRFAFAGLVLLGLALAAALLLIFKVVLDETLAISLTSGIIAWFAVWWYLLPKWTVWRHRPGRHADGP